MGHENVLFAKKNKRKYVTLAYCFICLCIVYGKCMGKYIYIPLAHSLQSYCIHHYIELICINMSLL